MAWKGFSEHYCYLSVVKIEMFIYFKIAWFILMKTHSLWTESIEQKRPKLESDVKTDVAIVGGGFSGLSAAYHLIKNNYSGQITILEKECVGITPGNSAGLVSASTPERDLQYEIEISGLEKALEIWSANQVGFETVRNIIKELHIPSMSEKGGVYLGSAEIADYLKKEADIRSRQGFAALFSDKPHVKAGNNSFSLIEPEDFLVNPAQFCQKLADYLAVKGVVIYEKSSVTKVEKEMGVLYTKTGIIDAEKIVLAGGNVPSQFKCGRKSLPIESYCLATEPLTENQIKETGLNTFPMFWNGDSPYFYGRLTPDKRLLVGGEDLFLFCSPLFSNKKTTSLERKFRKNFPQLENVKIEYAWKGPINVTADILPVVGQDKKHKRVYFSGNSPGMNYAVLSGRILADKISGDSSDDKDGLFSSERKIPLLPKGELYSSEIKFLWHLLTA